jgi:GNAT superfamily N-acetyltransferase
MFFREATRKDIPQMHAIRTAVHENKLSDPTLIKSEHYRVLLERGKGWVCEEDNEVQGFAVVDLPEAKVWALFVRPEKEGKFIGRMLHDMMIAWCFSRGMPKLWLTTDPNTRAERFYRKAGWTEVGVEPNGELRFEMENTLAPL